MAPEIPWPEARFGVTLDPLFFIASVLIIFSIWLAWGTASSSIGKWMTRRVPKNWSAKTKFKLITVAILIATVVWSKNYLLPTLLILIILYKKRDNLWSIPKRL